MQTDIHAEKRGEIIRRATSNIHVDAETVKPGRALHLTHDNRVVEQGDPEGAYLLVGENGSLPKDLAEELGIKPTRRHKADDAEKTADKDVEEKRPSGVAFHEEATEKTLHFGGKEKK